MVPGASTTLFNKLGFSVVAQQIPLAKISVPPVEITVPPLFAVVCVIADATSVETNGTDSTSVVVVNVISCP